MINASACLQGDFLLVILKDLLERRRESGFPLNLILDMYVSGVLPFYTFLDWDPSCTSISWRRCRRWIIELG